MEKEKEWILKLTLMVVELSENQKFLSETVKKNQDSILELTKMIKVLVERYSRIDS